MVNESDESKICAELRQANITPNILSTKSRDLYYSQIDDQTRNVPLETIQNCMTKTVQKNPTFPVFKYKSDPNGGFDMTITMDEYLKLIETAARSFITIGLSSKASVGIIGFNHPAWFISELGAIFAGGIACGIYTTNSAEICKFIMNDCNCQVAVVENDFQLAKVLTILPEVRHLKAIIKYTGKVTDECRNKSTIPIYTWTEFLELDTSKSKVEYETRLKLMKPNDCAILIYTSGTTGNPKGVMLSHDNMIFTAKMAMIHVEFKPFQNCVISYLPLSHVAANINDIFLTVIAGITVYFAQPDALRGSLAKTLVEVRPTQFIGVPRVFEKIQEQMQEMRIKANQNTSNTNDSSSTPKNGTDLSKVRAALGFDRCDYIGSLAAPLAHHTLDFFTALNITVHQIYGMSESSGPHSLGHNKKVRNGSAGNVLKGMEMKIVDPDENMIGEICMRGRHIFLGYYNAPEKTKETLDADGWLHSGDLGKMEDGEFLFITGRIKELIITAGGENVAPVPIEDRIKEELPFISYVMLVGDKQKFISCLLTLKTLVDPDTQNPTDTLTPAAIRSLNHYGIKATKTEDVLKCNDPILKKTIDDAMQRINTAGVSRAAYVQKWIFLPNDFSISGGELGPTMKMKRSVIADMYSNYINAMYS